MHYLEEEHQGAGFPWANHVLMGAMLCCFAYELTLGPAFQPFLTTYGWIPAQFSLALTQGQFPVSSSLLACLFLHGGGLHLVGNLLFLFFLGNAVEARLGAVRYVVLYLCGNIIALLTQAAMTPFSSTPMIGSSGAIAAVAGVYCLLFFSTQEPDTTGQPSLRPLEGASTILFLGGWVVFHVVGAISVYAVGETAFLSSTPIAWGAHIGGFLGGLILGPLLLFSLERHRRRFRCRYRPLFVESTQFSASLVFRPRHSLKGAVDRCADLVGECGPADWDGLRVVPLQGVPGRRARATADAGLPPAAEHREAPSASNWHPLFCTYR